MTSYQKRLVTKLNGRTSRKVDNNTYLSNTEGIRGVLSQRFPSLSSADRWMDREDHIILDSRVAEVSVSNYNGITSVCLAPLDIDNPLHVGWCQQNTGRFDACITEAFKHNRLLSQGTFSNGEQAFTLADEPGSCITSKEGRLW